MMLSTDPHVMMLSSYPCVMLLSYGLDPTVELTNKDVCPNHQCTWGVCPRTVLSPIWRILLLGMFHVYDYIGAAVAPSGRTAKVR